MAQGLGFLRRNNKNFTDNSQYSKDLFIWIGEPMGSLILHDVPNLFISLLGQRKYQYNIGIPFPSMTCIGMSILKS